jgi:hypothetical protein
MRFIKFRTDPSLEISHELSRYLYINNARPWLMWTSQTFLHFPPVNHWTVSSNRFRSHFCCYVFAAKWNNCPREKDEQTNGLRSTSQTKWKNMIGCILGSCLLLWSRHLKWPNTNIWICFLHITQILVPDKKKILGGWIGNPNARPYHLRWPVCLDGWFGAL